jgi:uncharacterized membrane protein
MDTDHYGKSQGLTLWIAYALHILLFPAALGALINAVKIREYRKPTTTEDVQHRDYAKLLASHHLWLLRTFLISLFFMAMALGTLYYGVGYLLGIGAVIWWIYRMVRGVIGYVEKKPMPV